MRRGRSRSSSRGRQHEQEAPEDDLARGVGDDPGARRSDEPNPPSQRILTPIKATLRPPHYPEGAGGGDGDGDGPPPLPLSQMSARSSSSAPDEEDRFNHVLQLRVSPHHDTQRLCIPKGSKLYPHDLKEAIYATLVANDGR